MLQNDVLSLSWVIRVQKTKAMGCTVIAWIMAIMACGVTRTAGAQAPAPAMYTDGQKVEVREGDTWSAASVVKREGRKYLIHYEGADGGSDEWVSSERIRLPGAPGGAAGASASAPAPAATVPATTNPAGAAAAPGKKLPTMSFANQDKVQAKWGGMWFDAVIQNKRVVGWYLVQYDREQTREWVEYWRVRNRGSTEDAIGHCHPNESFFANRPVKEPPRAEPGEPPAPWGAARSRGGGGEAGGAGDEQKAKEQAEKLTPVTPVDKAGAPEMPIGGSDFPPLAADPRPAPGKTVSTQPALLAGSNGGVFEYVQQLIFLDGGAACLLSYGDSRPSAPKATRVERVDLVAAKSVGVWSFPLLLSACDASADGKQLLAHSAGSGFGVANRLDVWSLETSEPKHVVSFKPYDDREGGNRDITWARFVAPDLIATLNNEGWLIAWDLKGKAAWTARADGHVQPMLSCTGKYLAVGTGESVAVLDPRTGKTLGLYAAPPLGSAVLSFSPDGKLLAATAQDLLLVWEVTGAKLLYELSPIGSHGRTLSWLGGTFVMIDGRFLMDLEQKLISWRYDRPSRTRPTDGIDYGSFAGRFWYVCGQRGSGKPALTSAVLPDEQVRKNIATLDPDQRMLVRPGSKVSLEVNLPGEMQQKVTDALRAKLVANGIVVADGQPIRLVATTESGPGREMAYRETFTHGFGPRNTTTITVNDLISRLTIFDAEGKKLWERSATRTAPFLVTRKENQGIQDAIAQQMQPSAAFFTQTRIPKFIPKAQHPPGAGASQLTLQGPVTEQ